jgi:hypothetical protein
MIIGQKVSTRMFHFHKEDREFSQEASSLGSINIMGPLYDDACDQGFVLVSQNTGKEIPFYWTDTERDAEGDIQCWNFKSAAKDPKLQDLTVTVFND